MKIKMQRNRAHIHDRIAQLIHEPDMVRKNGRDDEAVLGDIRVCITDKFREMQWR